VRVGRTSCSHSVTPAPTAEEVEGDGLASLMAEHAAGLPAVGFANSGGLVFVNESAEQIASAKVGKRGQRRGVAAVRREQLESAVWALAVVGA
jgi:hypothetical protein